MGALFCESIAAIGATTVKPVVLVATKLYEMTKCMKKGGVDGYLVPFCRQSPIDGLSQVRPTDEEEPHEMNQKGGAAASSMRPALAT